MESYNPEPFIEINYPNDYNMGRSSYERHNSNGHYLNEDELFQAQNEVNRLNSMVYNLENHILDMEVENNKLRQELQELKTQYKKLESTKVEQQVMEKPASWDVNMEEMTKPTSSSIRLVDPCL